MQRHATVFRTGWWAFSFRPLVRMCDSQSCSLFDFSYYASGTLVAVKNILYDKKPHTYLYLCSRPGPGIFHYFYKWFSRCSFFKMHNLQSKKKKIRFTVLDLRKQLSFSPMLTGTHLFVFWSMYEYLHYYPKIDFLKLQNCSTNDDWFWMKTEQCVLSSADCRDR